MGSPVHGSHLQPSDIGQMIPFATQEHVDFYQGVILTGIVQLSWRAPADGILEKGYFKLGTCGTGAGPTTCDILKNASSMLTAAMSIAHTDTDGTEVAASFDDNTVSRGDFITLATSAGATNQVTAWAGFTFRLLGS